MSRMNWQRIDELFDAAVDLPEDQQSDFLEQACGSQPELQSQLERLLEADRSARNFLARPIARLTGAAATKAGQRGRPIQRVGPYRILRPLAEGGMGSVFIASRDDDEFERLVAIKLVRRGLDSAQIDRRFRRERQILATLEHPHIARLYEGGTTAAGHPFLVMELVEGLPIDAHCDQHGLTVDQRLELFIEVCEAVTFAHRHLVIHRDLKPANILVTEAGDPKLLDFGIAKLLDTEHRLSEVTSTGLSPRTPAYSSPEQVRGEAVTTATDVYALGRLLYELLSGRAPYRLQSARILELEQAILNQEPALPSLGLQQEPAGGPSSVEIAKARGTDPSSLARRIAGDLDVIVSKALKKDPAERYGSPRELAQDLRRHLADLPVAARPDSPWYRARKFLRRHRPAVAVGLAFLGMILAFTLALLSQVEKTSRQRDLAEQVTTFVVGLFDRTRLLGGPGPEVTARQLVDAGADEIQRDLGNAPEVQAAIQHAIGSIYNQLAAYDEAEKLLSSALVTREALAEPADLASTLTELGVTSLERADERGAARYLDRALSLCERTSDAVCQATVHQHLGSLLTFQGDFRGAREALEQGLELLSRTQRRPSSQTAALLRELGRVDLTLQDYATAQQSFLRALETQEQLLGPDHPALATDLSNAAISHSARGEYPLAEQMWQRAIRLQEQATGRVHPGIANILNNLGILCELQARYDQASEHYTEALDIRREIYGADHPNLISTMRNFGALLLWRGEYDSARPLLQEAARIAETSLGAHLRTGRSWNLMAELSLATGDFDAARRHAHRALEIFEQIEDFPAISVASAWSNLGWIAYAEGSFVDSEKAYRKAVAVLETAPLAEKNWRASYLSRRASALYRLDRPEEAEASWRRALEVATRACDEDPASPNNQNQRAIAELGLAVIYGSRGQSEQRAAALQRAIEISANVAARSDFLRHLDTYAKALLILGDREAARPVVEHLRARSWNDPDFLAQTRGF
ncbi:MAG: serine/threonine-protein kinase [Acidobacteriota bacterium]